MPGWAADRQLAVTSSGDESGLQAAGGELPVLKALLRISEAVLRAHYFDEVLEVIAEQALIALAAASLSISRWEPQHGVLRTLINVGSLGPAEQRWPDDELYDVAADRHVTQLLAHGQPYTNAVDDEGSDPACVQVLRELGKESELAVPVMYEDAMWGEIWATGVDGRRFGHDDVQLLQAIAAHTAVAIGRSELLSTVWRYAHQDPLTGLANRRALDRHFTQIDWENVSPVVMVCDLDGFKQINDRQGHPAGDALLRVVAGVLDGLADATAGAFAARLGGDEFCVVLTGATITAAEAFANHASRAIRDTLGATVTVSWGAAAPARHNRTGPDLIAAADAALLEAKRQGPARFNAGAVASRTVPVGPDRGGERPGRRRRALHRLLPRVVRILGQTAPLTVPAALEVLAVQVQKALNTAAWSLSASTDDGAQLRTLSNVDSVRDPDSGLSVLTSIGDSTYPLADYPASAQVITTGGTFVAAEDVDGSNPAETALLRQLGYRAVLGIGVPTADGQYLLEFYSHDSHGDLLALAPYVEVLAQYCAAKATSATRQ